MNRNCIFLLIWIFWVPAVAWSQVNDMGLWLSAGIEKKITQQFSVTLSEEMRFNENISEAGTIFTDVGIGYRMNKNLRVSANYRYISRRNPDDSYRSDHRYYMDLSYRIKTGVFSWQLRERFQLQDDSPNMMAAETPGEYYLRSKFTLRYDPGRRMIPYLYAETYHLLNNADHAPFRKMRYCAGVDYELTTRHAVTAFYLVQTELNVNNPETDYVIGLGYNFSF